MEKAAESASAPPESESGQSRLRNPTLDQIVHRAAILLRNGQYEARIDLKPDFFGHIRMQVISENQQVTVKILAEHGFVKDMIESNVHQLKADLQQHGLAVDKLEVTVSRDPEDPGHSREKLAQSKTRQGNAGHPNEDRPTGGQQTDSRRWRPTAPGIGSVDYFA
jgi:flagellar hook-length control protein FliK